MKGGKGSRRSKKSKVLERKARILINFRKYKFKPIRYFL